MATPVTHNLSMGQHGRVRELRHVAALAFVAVGIGFIADALTQQILMVALLYVVPIAVAALTPSRRLTKVLVVSAVILNAAAAGINASREQNWNVVALEDRILVTVSIGVTGILTIALQVRNENARLITVINELVNAVAHDVRTPLAALSTTLSQAAQGAFGELPAEYCDVLRDSRVSIDDLQRTAETLLLIARYESGEDQNDRELVAVATTVRELVSEFSAMAQARGVALRADFACGDSERALVISRADLRRAIANLIANAITHTPRGGAVEVRVRVEAEQLQVVVADDGYGVTNAMKSMLFEGSTASGSASGLGLYIVRRIAEESGGQVLCEPRVPRGSIFKLSFPRVT